MRLVMPSCEAAYGHLAGDPHTLVFDSLGMTDLVMPSCEAAYGHLAGDPHTLVFDSVGMTVTWLEVSMKFLFCWLLIVGFSSVAHAGAELKILSNRTEGFIQPILAEFTKQTGIKTSLVSMGSGLINRLEARPEEADVVVSKNGYLLEIAKQKKLLQPYVSEDIDNKIYKFFRDKDNYYFVDAFRGRVVFYSNKRVMLGMLSDYEDLAKPKWKGKLCMRSGYHDYNISFFAQMIAVFGKKRAKKLMIGYRDNLARTPQGNDREQARGIYQGKCDLAIMNTYYHPIMQGIPAQKPWAAATSVFFPDQKGGGAYNMRSAVALTKSRRHIKEATKLLEFIASEAGQKLMTNLTFQYPTNTSVVLPKQLTTLAVGQESIKDGVFIANVTQLSDIVKNREEAIKILNEIKFDKK